MIVNLIVVLAMYISLPLIWWMLRSASFERNNLILSVTLPPEGRKDPQVLELAARFRKQMKIFFWVMTMIVIPAVVVPWVSVCTLYSLIWLIAVIFVPYILFAKANTALKKVKRERGWVVAGSRKTVAALPTVQQPERLSVSWFLPPVIFSAVPVISVLRGGWPDSWNIVLLATVGCCLLVTLMSLAIYPLVFRQKLDALDEDDTLTAALTRVRRYNWTKCWMGMSWITAIYSLVVWGCRGNMAWYLLWTAVYSLIILGISLQTELTARRAQRTLTMNREESPQVDEDDRWLWGLVYYNPDDNHNFVNERVGMGMAMNMARPAGKWMMGISLVILLAMPLLGVWLMVEEFSPIQLSLQGDTIVSQQAFTTYEIPLDQIENAKLLESMPSASRIAGTGMKNLLKGSFVVEGYGNASLCLDPNEPPFIFLETDERTYILGGDNTAEIYRLIQEN